MARKENRDAGFAISTYHQSLIEDNADDSFKNRAEFRKMVLDQGYMNAQGEITKKGYEVLSEDLMKFERNALAWLRKNFLMVSDQGHDSHDDLVGNVVWSPRSKKQRELLELGKNERIDGTDSSYGDLARTAWKGCSDFGASVLGGQINFFDTGLD